MFELAQLREPVVQAPMGGGPSTPELAAAVCRAGGLGFLAAGYREPEAVREQVTALQAAVEAPFGVNLFLPAPASRDAAGLEDYLRELEPEAAAQGVELGEARYSDDAWERKLDVLVEARPAVVSFTFGCPSTATVRRLHAVEVAVWVTVTTPEEAEQAAAVGADALVVQGTEAGGHRGGFRDDDEASGFGLLALLRIIAQTVELPLVASGGIPDGAAVAAVLCAGAAAAQVGTALMLCPEAGTAEAQRALLARRAPTRLTRAFSGRRARGIVNRFLIEHPRPRQPPTHRFTTPPARCARRPAAAATPTPPISGPGKLTSSPNRNQPARSSKTSADTPAVSSASAWTASNLDSAPCPWSA